MSSMHRTLEGDVLVHHLKEDERMIDQTLLARHGRSARTLVKQGPLRLTMIALAPNGSLAPHAAAGPITMYVVEGAIVFNALGQDYAVQAGDVLVMAPGVTHSVRSELGGVFLLTVVHAESAGSPVTSE